MTNPFDNGVIRQQEIRDRSIARQRIALAIQKEAQRTGILVDLAISRITANPTNLPTAELLWYQIQRDNAIIDAQQLADRNAADYTGFEGWLNGSRKRIEETEKNRLRNALRKPDYQRRFAYTVGVRPAFA